MMRLASSGVSSSRGSWSSGTRFSAIGKCGVGRRSQRDGQRKGKNEHQQKVTVELGQHQLVTKRHCAPEMREAQV